VVVACFKLQSQNVIGETEEKNIRCTMVNGSPELSTSMEQNPSSEASSRLITQELSSILWNPKVRYHVLKSPPVVPIMNRINPIHSTAYCFSVLRIKSESLICNSISELLTIHAWLFEGPGFKYCLKCACMCSFCFGHCHNLPHLDILS
jgi:hypothetical protein